MKTVLVPARAAIHRGDIVWDSREKHWNMFADRVIQKFGQPLLVGSDGRTLPVKFAISDGDKRAQEQREHDLQEIARLKAEYPEEFVTGDRS